MAALWQLLILICFVIPIGGAMSAAKIANAPPAGFALAILVGLVVGMSCAWTMWLMHKLFVAKLEQHPDWQHSAWFARTFYASKLLWIVVALFLGHWLSSRVLRIIF
jgi:uncharacterized protein YneF (UPF0154 family)